MHFPCLRELALRGKAVAVLGGGVGEASAVVGHHSDLGAEGGPQVRQAGGQEGAVHGALRLEVQG